MKTLAEVKAHFKNVGYRHQDMPRIEGFLFGKGLFEGDEFEIEFMCGERDFYDFKDWFNGEEQEKEPIDWSEFGYGDFIHVEDDLNVFVLSDIYDNTFVGVNGNSIYVFSLTEESRPCDEQEIEEVENNLKKAGFSYCYDNGDFIPFDKCKACENEKSNDCLENKLKLDMVELRKIAESMSKDNPLKDFAMTMTRDLEKIVSTTLEKGKTCDCVDKLEVDAKDAIENIVAAIHANELDPQEKELVIGALEALVILGHEYE